jgi:hypothetical protein
MAKYMYPWYLRVAYWVWGRGESRIEYSHSSYILPKTNPKAKHIIAKRIIYLKKKIHTHTHTYIYIYTLCKYLLTPRAENNQIPEPSPFFHIE